VPVTRCTGKSPSASRRICAPSSGASRSRSGQRSLLAAQAHMQRTRTREVREQLLHLVREDPMALEVAWATSHRHTAGAGSLLTSASEGTAMLLLRDGSTSGAPGRPSPQAGARSPPCRRSRMPKPDST
jgi:hypothetical protein